jgi:hypothetical protein
MERVVKIVLIVIVTALIRSVLKWATGREELFPANPKGPLYKWFGGASSKTPRQ